MNILVFLIICFWEKGHFGRELFGEQQVNPHTNFDINEDLKPLKIFQLEPSHGTLPTGVVFALNKNYI